MHYENTFAFATATSLVREMEISHWGNVYFREEYNLVRLMEVMGVLAAFACCSPGCPCFVSLSGGNVAAYVCCSIPKLR